MRSMVLLFGSAAMAQTTDRGSIADTQYCVTRSESNDKFDACFTINAFRMLVTESSNNESEANVTCETSDTIAKNVTINTRVTLFSGNCSLLENNIHAMIKNCSDKARKSHTKRDDRVVLEDWQVALIGIGIVLSIVFAGVASFYCGRSSRAGCCDRNPYAASNGARAGASRRYPQRHLPVSSLENEQKKYDDQKKEIEKFFKGRKKGERESLPSWFFNGETFQILPQDCVQIIKDYLRPDHLIEHDKKPEERSLLSPLSSIF